MLRIKCYAKINLGLRIVGKRADGYHELRTVFQTISLHDSLEAWRERGRAAVRLECNVPELAGPENLASRAAEMMLEELGLRARVCLRLRKAIPAGAGLGGGSSDAAAALRAVEKLAGRRLPLEREMALAAALGADVPFFLLGGRALGLGRGTEVYPLPEPASRPLLVVYPGLSISTARAYASLTVSTEADRIASFCASVGERRGDRLKNDFEPVVFSTYPQLARLKRHLLQAGAAPVLLSGSGSAMYGFFGSRQKAERAGRIIRARYPGWRVWVARTVGRGAIERQW